ncbi:hypothetical protein N7453_003864 [Penicillium expansum]|nr:hypothetical protein N7453_003864 [Penicillium expansum]
MPSPLAAPTPAPTSDLPALPTSPMTSPSGSISRKPSRRLMQNLGISTDVSVPPLDGNELA